MQELLEFREEFRLPEQNCLVYSAYQNLSPELVLHYNRAGVISLFLSLRFSALFFFCAHNG